MNIFGIPSVSIDMTQYATNTYVNSLQTRKVSISRDTMSGPLNMGNNKIINIADPTSAQNGAT